MKIVHILFGGAFNEDMSYQGNILTREHKKAGHEVTIIASCYKWEKGTVTKVAEEDSFTKDGIRLIRIKFDSLITESVSRKVKKSKKLMQIISDLNPDIIFHHDVQSFELLNIAKYKKHNPNVKLYVDNHTDWYNSGTNWISKNILHKIFWRFLAKKVEYSVDKFYGVLPSRVSFLTDVYKLEREKVELLLMGAEDEKVKEALNRNVTISVRKQLKIEDDNFLILAGGKIDSNKPQILDLMRAIIEINNPNIKLVLFGSVEEKYKETFFSMLNENIKFIGWIHSDEIYKYFSASDLIVFPGLHSVLWEQAVGLGKPCVFKYIEGFDHVDLGGNCQFLYEDSINEIKGVIQEIIENEDLYNNMKSIAISKGINKFSYSRIAEKSILN